MKKIPKICYFYWGNNALPYLRYRCLTSFKRMNPDWKVLLFLPNELNTNQTWKTFENKVKVQTEDYMPRLIKEGQVMVARFDMESLGFSNDMPEVLKSDVLRLHLMANLGGMWCDNDQIFFRPVSYVFPENVNPNAVAYFCFRRGGPTQEDTPKNGPRYHSIGLLMGAPGNKYYKALLEGAKKALGSSDDYQAVGSLYYKTLYNEGNIEQLVSSGEVVNIDINTYCPSRAVPGMWQGTAEEYRRGITPNTISFHWYGGHPKSGEMQNLITESTYMNYDNVVCWILREMENRHSPDWWHQF